MSIFNKQSKVIAWLLCASMLFALSSYSLAQQKQGVETSQGLYQKLIPRVYTKGLVWKIEGDGIKPGYLLGTMHVDDPQIINMLKVVDKELRNAEIVCTEVKMDFMAISAEMESMFFHDGRTLKSVTGQELYSRILEILEERSMPEVMIKNMKPWVAAYILSAPLPEEKVLDERIYNGALKRGQKVCGLETSDEHGKAFDSLPMQYQIYMLRKTIMHMKETKQSYQDLRKAYLDRDLYKLVEVTWASPWMEDRTIVDKFIEELIIKRNIRMAARMQDVLKTGNVFFAIGALHLPGEMGVLRLLEKRGYRISVVY